MCRRNHLFGIAVVCFGAGLLVGCWMDSQIIRACLGVGILVAGVLLLQKK